MPSPNPILSCPVQNVTSYTNLIKGQSLSANSFPGTRLLSILFYSCFPPSLFLAISIPLVHLRTSDFIPVPACFAQATQARSERNERKTLRDILRKGERSTASKRTFGILGARRLRGVGMQLVLYRSHLYAPYPKPCLISLSPIRELPREGPRSSIFHWISFLVG